MLAFGCVIWCGAEILVSDFVGQAICVREADSASMFSCARALAIAVKLGGELHKFGGAWYEFSNCCARAF